MIRFWRRYPSYRLFRYHFHTTDFGYYFDTTYFGYHFDTDFGNHFHTTDFGYHFHTTGQEWLTARHSIGSFENAELNIV